MGKKSVNPADAHRKKQRKKEIEKNKAKRVAAREMAVVNKDTTKLEREMERLQELASQRQLDKAGHAKLKNLKEELENIQKTKEAHGVTPQSAAVAAAAAKHAMDESRKLVFDPKKGAFVPISKKKLAKMAAKKAKEGQHQGSDQSDDSEDDSDEDSDVSESENELLPELPVIKGDDILEEEEQAKAAAEEASKIEDQEDQEHEEHEKDVSQGAEAQQDEAEVADNDKEGIPLPNEDENEDDDSDIESIPMPKGPPPPKPFERQLGHNNLTRPPPPPPPRHYRPAPAGLGYRPPPPPPRPLHMQQGHYYGHAPPPPPRAAATAYYPRPTGPDPAAAAQSPAVQPVNNDVNVESTTTEVTNATVTISAAPQVRDLQKELVGFVPAAVRKKKLQAGKKGIVPKVARPTINAAPDMDDDDVEQEQDRVQASPSIQLPATNASAKSSAPKAGDEYDRFMKEMEGIL